MKHELSWHTHAWEDYLYWFENDLNILKKINNLIKAIDREPFKGIGKPEPLKHLFKGFWSRRITHEHRLVYALEKQRLIIASCRYHYSFKD